MNPFDKWYETEFKPSFAYPLVVRAYPGLTEEALRSMARLFWELGYDRGYDRGGRQERADILLAEPVVEFQYKGATISGSAKDIAAVQEILASEQPDYIDALIADLGNLPRHIDHPEIDAIIDKYRSKK